MGALLAHSTPPALKAQWKNEVLGWLGFAMIIYSIVTYDANTPFPGHYALLPCLGSAILLYVGVAGSGVSRLLSIKPLSIIGNMSYSLYLVHWPVIVFTYFLTLRKPTSLNVFWIVVITFVLSYISWKYVEGPFRHIDTKKYRARILGSGVAIIVFFSGLGLFGTYNNGFPERFPDYQHVDIPGNKNFWNRKTCFLSTNPDYNDWAGDECALTEGEEEVLFWGDSFAAHYTPGIKEHKDLFNHKILQYTAAGCPPILSYVSMARLKCTTFNKNALDIIDTRKIKKVILAARWSILKTRDGLESLHSTLDELKKRNLEIYVVGQSPEFAIDIRVLGYFNRELYKDQSIAWWDPSYDKKINTELAEIIAPATFVDPIKTFCNAELCPYSIDEKFLFEDHAHYSVHGSIRAVGQYFPLRTEKKQASSSQTTTPVPRVGRWLQFHQQQKEALSTANPQIVWIGDSITQQWDRAGKSHWADLSSKYRMSNLGIGGDRTQHVLWRLQEYDWSRIQPDIAVVMIGTNNIGHDAPDSIKNGIVAVIDAVHAKSPTTQILLLGVFPRGTSKVDSKRIIAKEINRQLAGHVWSGHVQYIDLWDRFLEEDGELTKEMMPDALHLSPKGYKIWHDVMMELFSSKIQEK